jgi:hypothetical protein
MVTALLLLALESGRQRASLPPVIPADWKIEISTTGGFAGSGTGGFTVASNGVLTITLINKKQCTYQLTASELQMLNSAVANTQPATWLECYTLADQSKHCCDLVTTTLKLSERDGRDVFVTSWLMGPLPVDLQQLVDVLRGPAGIETRYRQLCATTP